MVLGGAEGVGVGCWWLVVGSLVLEAREPGGCGGEWERARRRWTIEGRDRAAAERWTMGERRRLSRKGAGSGHE